MNVGLHVKYKPADAESCISYPKTLHMCVGVKIDQYAQNHPAPSGGVLVLLEQLIRGQNQALSE